MSFLLAAGVAGMCWAGDAKTVWDAKEGEGFVAGLFEEEEWLCRSIMLLMVIKTISVLALHLVPIS